MSDRNETVIFSTLISLGWGVIVIAILLISGFVETWWIAIIMGAAFAFMNPIIGKIFVSIGLQLCNAVDKVFQLPQQKRNSFGRKEQGFQWGNWSANTQIYFAALWPATGLFIIVMASIALIFGVLFQSLFKDG